jgi:hypothetical protein
MLKRRDERDLLIPAYGVHDRRSVPAAELVANLRSHGWLVYEIVGAPASRAAFHEAIRALPGEPPLGPGPNWNALKDSLGGGLFELQQEQVAIVWAGSGQLAEHDPDSYRIAREILTDLTFELADPKFSPQHVTRLLVLVA